MQLAHPRQLVRSQEVRGGNPTFELLALQVSAQLTLERRQRQAYLRQGLFGEFGIVFAGNLKCGLGADGLVHIRLADAVAQIVRPVAQDQVADHRLQQLILQHRFLGGRYLRAEALLPLALAPLPGIAGVVDGDLLASRLGRIRSRPHTEVDDPVGSPGGENHRECSQHDIRQPFLGFQAVTNPLQHLS